MLLKSAFVGGFFGVGVLLSLPSVASADFRLSDWLSTKELTVQSPGLVRFAIDDEVFSGSKSDLSDLRIISPEGKEVPYKLSAARVTTEVQSLAFPISNNSSVPGESTSVIIDTSQAGPINELSIRTASRNFQRNVTVYGSDDRTSWRVLRENAYIYDYLDGRGNFHATGTTISIPTSTFASLKIVIDDPKGSPVVILGVTGRQTKTVSAREVFRELPYQMDKDAESQESMIVIDEGSEGIPASRVKLEIDEKNFNRSVIVESGDDRVTWRRLGQDYIFRYATPRFFGEKTEVTFPETFDRYLRLRILDYDDQSLTLGTLRLASLYREVVFEAKQAGIFSVYFGNPGAHRPVYDFEQYVAYLDPSSATEAVSGARYVNAAYVAPVAPPLPFSERYPYLLPGALILFVASLTLIMLRFIRNDR
ncbi:MAG: DUF3999 family protein [Candidatus Moraniibacteriota bacterium]|nr:MAG: DUF3999 family protein [Candidatus Moranbacteria bacterium]